MRHRRRGGSVLAHPRRQRFHADVMLTDGRPLAKFGRRYRENQRLEQVM
jgi:hypothetical protein